MAIVLVGVVMALAGCAAIPNSWNWRDNNTVTPVKDQATCRAGWAFAATAAYEAYLLRTTGSVYNLAEEYLIQCSGGGDCSGVTSILTTLDFIVANGMPTTANLSYTSGAYLTGKAPENSACSLSTVKPQGKLSYRAYEQVSSDFLKRQLSLGVMVSGIYMNSGLRGYTGTAPYKCIDTGNYFTANLKDVQQPWLPSQLNHFVLLVGYDSSTNFIFKNSYGTGWGDGGYAKVVANYDCGIRLLVLQLWSARAAALALITITLL